MEKQIKITEIQLPGKLLFVYSDQYNIYFFYFNEEDQKLYKITTCKYYYIEHVDEIYLPEGYEDFIDIKFYKPYLDKKTDELVYIGYITANNGNTQNFKVNNTTSTLEVQKDVTKADYYKVNFINCLKDFNIISYIQKADKIYLIADDVKYESYVYAVVDVKEDKLLQVYSLYSDLGIIIPTSININKEDDRVIVVGYIELLNNDNEVIGNSGYIEQFLLK